MPCSASLSLDDIRRHFAEHDWRFAKTMPQVPHWYTLRKNWKGPADFEAVVQYIRERGYKMRWGRYNHTYLDIDGWRYWTMGAPLPETILINREEIKDSSPYDAIAPMYDTVHQSVEARIEDIRLMRAVAYRGGSVLDIGCGTGLFLDHVQPDAYVGIDPSAGMLHLLSQKHAGVDVRKSTFEEFKTTQRFDLVIGLYGAPSYVAAEALKRIPGMLTNQGRYFLMFYRDDYAPVTYQRTGVIVPHFNHPRDVLPGRVHEFGGFWIVEGQR